MKLGDLLKATNPISGKETSLIDIGGIVSAVMGVVLLLFVVATGQNVANMISNKFGRIDASVQPLTSTPAQANKDVIL